MGIMALRHKTEALQKCDLPECKNVSRTLYRVRIGEMWYKFCSGFHAQDASDRFKQHASLGLTDPNPQEDRIETPEGGDNLSEFE